MEQTEIRPLRQRDLPQMEALLAGEGLKKDARLDYSAGVFEDGALIATGSCAGNTLRCLAVDRARQGEGLLNRLMEHLTRVQYERGNFHLFLYTKPASARFFGDLGYAEIARDGERTVFLENRRAGFTDYLDTLRRETGAAAGRVGALVMNANPFTLGHRYLAQYAAARCDVLHLFVVSEDASAFPAADRLELVRRGTAHLSNVICHKTESYLVSRATFPSYFLPDDDAATLSQARLEAAVFLRIAAHLGISERFLGTEPLSRVTAAYNEALGDLLPRQGVTCTVVPRLEAEGGEPISASAVRRALAEGDWEKLAELVPESTLDYLNSEKGASVAQRLRAVP